MRDIVTIFVMLTAIVAVTCVCWTISYHAGRAARDAWRQWWSTKERS